MTGQPTLVAPASAAVLPLIRAGEMRALAATTRQRSPLLAEVPTLHELGFTGFEVVEHVSLLAPAGTPAPLLQRYNAIAAAALRAPEMQPRWEALALAVEARPAEAWPDYFRGENDKWRAVLRSRGIRMP
jgi:tripartite-type tricarboxylate transporter receptor subunit TctC